MINNIDDRLLSSRVLDLYEMSITHNKAYFTKFLSPENVTLAKATLKNVKFTSYNFFGGFENAERVILGVFPNENMLKEFLGQGQIKKEISVIKISNSSEEILTHRDFLGALLNLGINREVIGDILIQNGEKTTFVYVIPEISVFIKDNLLKVKNTKVFCEILEELPKISKEQKFSQIRITVASPRLDGVLSSMLKLSREKATALIESERVSINFQIMSKSTTHIKENNIISIKGYGRYKVENCDGLTKKGRYIVNIVKYE